jgi:hypothetical protein
MVLAVTVDGTDASAGVAKRCVDGRAGQGDGGAEGELTLDGNRKVVSR